MKFVHSYFVKILLALALAALVSAFFSGCSLAPRYKRPAVETPATFKESPGTNNLDTNIWQVAQPGDALIRSNWWVVFNDTNLDALEDQVAISNQNVIVAFENYRVAHEEVREAQADYFPTLTSSPGVTRQRMHCGQLAAQQFDLAAQPVEHPVHFAGLIAAQRLRELDGVHVRPGDTGSRQHGGSGGALERRQGLAAPEHRADDHEQHRCDEHQHHQVQQDQRHDTDTARSP